MMIDSSLLFLSKLNLLLLELTSNWLYNLTSIPSLSAIVQSKIRAFLAFKKIELPPNNGKLSSFEALLFVKIQVLILIEGIGTLSYMSPEMINEENYDSKTDVYSYGIVLHYLFIGKLPVYNMKDKINGKAIPLPKPSSSITEFGIEMITKCTNHTPSKRPSFEEILKDIRAHSFSLAPEIDQALIIRRDRELSFYESQKS